MICHAPEAAPFPVFPLALAMIAPNLRVLLVAAIGPPPLLAPPPAAALIPAVDLPPVAGTADVKHRPATRPPAKHLPPHHFSGHVDQRGPLGMARARHKRNEMPSRE